MTKKDYLAPSVRIRFVNFDSPLCGDSLETNPDKPIDDEDDFEAWSKGFDAEDYGSVWEEE